MDKQKNLTIEHRSYLCHPETCCHKDHYSFWVLEDGNYIRGFDTEIEAKSFIKTLVDKEVEVTELEKEWLEMNQELEKSNQVGFQVEAENRELQKRVGAVTHLIRGLRAEFDLWMDIECPQVERQIELLEQALKGEAE